MMKNNNKVFFKNSKRSGFTMIELLIVIVILGILSAIGLGSFTAAQTKSRDSNRKSSLSGIASSLEVYYNDQGSYPLQDPAGSGNIMGCGVGGAGICTYGEIWQDDAGTVYMVQMPSDPSGNSFFYISDGVGYKLYARLENTNDGSVPLDASDNIGVYTEVLAECGGLGCNYGLASSNITLDVDISED